MATSTALAELKVTYWTAIDVVGIRNLMEELGFPQDKATVIYTDNTAVKSIISGRMSLGSKNKHVELRCLKTKEWHRRAFIEIETERTVDMVADFLTKNLDVAQFEYLRDWATGYSYLKAVLHH